MVKKRLFLHPTFDCSFDKVCRDDCYLLAGKTDKEKQFRLPDEYWTSVVKLAGESGFEELSLPINPLRGVTGVTDPLYWLRLLAPIAREYEMVINTTMTLDVAEKLLPTDEIDTVAISLDEFRIGKNWKRYAKKLTKVVEHLQALGIETNCNLSVSGSSMIQFYANTPMHKYLKDTFDYTTSLWPKPLKEAGILTRGAARLIIRGEANGSSYPFLIGENEGFLEDYCMSYERGESNCDAGVNQLSLDAFGRLAICPYSGHTVDVSTTEKFQHYLDQVLPKAEYISSCSLMETDLV
jgi:hypothetical protein